MNTSTGNVTTAHIVISSTLPASTTLIPVVDTVLGVIFLALIAVASGLLILLATWVVIVILVSKAYTKNNFVYYVLCLGIADFILSIGQLVSNPEYILAPNSWGGVSSPLFSYLFTNVSQSIGLVGATQHYLTLAVIAVERLYSVLRPLDYDKRGPPIIIVVGLLLFFAVNLAVTTGVLMATSAETYNAGYVGWFVNDYVAIALVVLVMLIYVVLVVVVRRQGSQNVGIAASAEAEAKITKAVLQVGAVFFATAFVFTVLYTILMELGSSGLIASGPYDAATDFIYIPIVVGEIIDLSIFAIRIEEIKTPSIKYLKKMRIACCGLTSSQQSGSTSTACLALFNKGSLERYRNLMLKHEVADIVLTGQVTVMGELTDDTAHLMRLGDCVSGRITVSRLYGTGTTAPPFQH